MLLGGDADGPEASYFFEHSWDGENFVSISSIPPKQKIPWEHVRGIHRPFFNSSNEISIRKKKQHMSIMSIQSFQNLSRNSQSEKPPKKTKKKKRKMSSSQRQPSPGAPGRRALLLLHFFGGLLGHLQVRLEAGFGGSQWIMMDYDMIYIYYHTYTYIYDNIYMCDIIYMI
jgi:hypothetical protein